MKNARLYLLTLKPAKPKASPIAPPVYARREIYGGITDNRAAWQQRWDAHHGEALRLEASEISARRTKDTK